MEATGPGPVAAPAPELATVLALEQVLELGRDQEWESAKAGRQRPKLLSSTLRTLRA